MAGGSLLASGTSSFGSMRDTTNELMLMKLEVKIPDLPETFDSDYLTSELYGVVEHHVRQIRTGLFGFFD